MINKFIRIASDRMKFFSDKGIELGRPIRDIDEYKKVTGQSMPLVSIFVDEMMVLIDQLDPDIFVRLYAMGRSSGIYLYALAQYLNDKILPRKCTANIINRVFMGAPDNVALRTLFPGGIPKPVKEEIKTHLGPPGKALLYNGNTNTYRCVTFPRIDDSVLEELMQ